MLREGQRSAQSNPADYAALKLLEITIHSKDRQAAGGFAAPQSHVKPNVNRRDPSQNEYEYRNLASQRSSAARHRVSLSPQQVWRSRVAILAAQRGQAPAPDSQSLALWRPAGILVG